MNIRTRPVIEEKGSLVLGALRYIQSDDRLRLIWFHVGQQYVDLPKGVPYLVEYVNEGENSYIETTRMDTLEPYPLSLLHLVTTGISKKSDGTFEVARSSLQEYIQDAIEGHLKTNFCAVPSSDIVQYIETRRSFLSQKLCTAMEETHRLHEKIKTYEKRAEAFSEDRGLPFRRVFTFS